MHSISSILLDLVELFLKLSDLDDFGFPICIKDGKSVRIVDNAENIRFDILFDDANLFRSHQQVRLI